MTAPTGYGADTWCADSLVTGRTASGWRVVAQALFRRVTTERGTLRGGEEESAYGIDLAGYVGAVGYPTAVAALPGIVRGEWMKDDRVSDVRVDAYVTRDASGLVDVVLDGAVVLADSGETFALTIRVGDGGVQLALAEAAT